MNSPPSYDRHASCTACTAPKGPTFSFHLTPLWRRAMLAAASCAANAAGPAFQTRAHNILWSTSLIFFKLPNTQQGHAQTRPTRHPQVRHTHPWLHQEMSADKEQSNWDETSHPQDTLLEPEKKNIFVPNPLEEHPHENIEHPHVRFASPPPVVARV